MILNHDAIYEIRESSEEYPIFNLAKWVRVGAVPRFHVFKTIEISPREITIHDSQIVGVHDSGRTKNRN